MKTQSAKSSAACCPAAAPRRAAAGDHDQQLAELSKALAHPARLRILRLLLERDACICGEIVDRIPLAQSTVSQHLKVLKDAGLIRGDIDGPRICYCIDHAVFARFKELVAGL